MSRRWLLGLLLVLVAISPCRAQPGALDKDELVWGADADGGAPYVFKDPANPKNHIGFEVDLAEALSKQIGKPIRYRQYQFDSIIPGVEIGDIDIGMNGLEITEDRKKRVLFSRPYYIYRLQLVVRKGDKTLTDLDDAIGKPVVIGTLAGSVGERALDRRKIAKRVYDDQRGPYVDLLQGQIDGVLMDLPIALYYARREFKDDSPVYIPGLEFRGPAVDPGAYAIAVNKKDERLVKAINDALDKLIKNGELRRIYRKWGLWNEDQVELDDEGATTDTPTISYRFSDILTLLLQGAVMTVALTFASMFVAVLIGLPLALCRMYGPAPVRALSIGYIEFFRGIPILLLLYFVYYGLPGIADEFHLPFSLKMPAWFAAVLGFGLNYAAYEAEIYRAGINAIPRGQWEAAASLGMSNALAFRRIILPQTIRLILPPSTNDLVALFKDTSVVSVIAVVELTKQYQILTKNGASFLQVGLATAALYLIMSVPLGYLSRYLERVWGEHA